MYRENDKTKLHVLCNPELANAKPRDILAKACAFVQRKFSERSFISNSQGLLPRADNGCIYGYYCQESCFQLKII